MRLSLSTIHFWTFIEWTWYNVFSIHKTVQFIALLRQDCTVCIVVYDINKNLTTEEPLIADLGTTDSSGKSTLWTVNDFHWNQFSTQYTFIIVQNATSHSATSGFGSRLWQPIWWHLPRSIFTAFSGRTQPLPARLGHGRRHEDPTTFETVAIYGFHSMHLIAVFVLYIYFSTNTDMLCYL